MSHMSISQFIKRMNEEYKNEARENYLQNRRVIEALDGKVNKECVTLSKDWCIMSAGIVNKDKQMYEKGYRLTIKQMYKMVENDDSNNRVLFDMNDNASVTRNENAYLTMCNHFKKQKEMVDERHKNLIAYGYFD